MIKYHRFSRLSCVNHCFCLEKCLIFDYLHIRLKIKYVFKSVSNYIVSCLLSQKNKLVSNSMKWRHRRRTILPCKELCFLVIEKCLSNTLKFFDKTSNERSTSSSSHVCTCNTQRDVQQCSHSACSR